MHALVYAHIAQIHEIKEYLDDKHAPFGVDLALPQVGGTARKTNVGPTCLLNLLTMRSTIIRMGSCLSS